jgi:hypothetical protein
MDVICSSDIPRPTVRTTSWMTLANLCKLLLRKGCTTQALEGIIVRRRGACGPLGGCCAVAQGEVGGKDWLEGELPRTAMSHYIGGQDPVHIEQLETNTT